MLVHKNCDRCNAYMDVPDSQRFCHACLADMRDVPGFPGYMAHRDGYVWNTTRGTRLNTNGLTVSMYRKDAITGKKRRWCRSLGHVILSAFRPPTRDDVRAMHKDGNPYRNHLSNLDWEPDPLHTVMPPDMVEGVWRRQIPEHPEYAADEQGRIWRYGKPWPLHVHGNRVYLSRNGKSAPYHIAPLVLHAFKGKELDSQIPLWKDGNRYNNRPDNLKWTDYVAPQETLSSRCNVSPKHTHKAKPRSFTLEEIERGEHLT